MLRIIKEPILLIHKHRKIIRAVYTSDLRSRYAAGNKLGWIWLILYPLLFLGVYSLLWLGLSTTLDRVANVEYILLIIGGFIAWMGISEIIAFGIATIHANVGILKNTVFPIEILSVRQNLVAITQVTVSYILLLLVYTARGQASITWLQLPLLLIIHFFGCVGLTWILAVIGAFYRDLLQIINIILMMLLMITPIAYLEEMVSGPLVTINKYNIFTYMLRAYRIVICNNNWVTLKLYVFLILGTLILFYLGYYLFSRIKPLFSDLV